ncbi:polysaccharide deacetylase family protein [Paenibacillus sp. SGZ-1009]|uniref:polysaccharide deacetylase family protein n=1 Tax=Paenibacillus campi TaxID=3106031 RepID=UPI002AFF8257|nr:polysaccharide deacetylase family protein [Paenibacillus sp. SGZ-1009]
MMGHLFLWLLYICSFYAFIPGLISRLFGYRVFRRGNSETAFALTFDDGPDPIYTPLLLDLLKRYNAKATFFVVGRHAELYPDIVRRIHQEGHQIGIHNYIHRANWLMSPTAVRRQIYLTQQIIYQLTGKRPIYYRPPWGIVNQSDLSRHSHYDIVLWSCLFGDWRKRVGREKLAARMLHKLSGGEIMLLHDCGNTWGADRDAPAEMLAALEIVLQAAQQRGLEAVTIGTLMEGSDYMSRQRKDRSAREGEDGTNVRRAPLGSLLSPFKKVLIGLWLGWEKLFHRMFHLQKTGPGGLFHYRLRAYHGRPLELESGEWLERGDPIIELHFDNKQLFELTSGSRSMMQLAILFIQAAREDFPKLAIQMQQQPELMQARALYGVSMINRGPQKFGFAVRELPQGVFAILTRWYLKMLLTIIHPAGSMRLKEQSDHLIPRAMVVSTAGFIQRYSDHMADVASAAQTHVTRSTTTLQPDNAAVAQDTLVSTDVQTQPS